MDAKRTPFLNGSGISVFRHRVLNAQSLPGAPILESMFRVLGTLSRDPTPVRTPILSLTV